jgi:ubiquinone/menaquinone biosynthesis C-methylase UbiE
VARSGLGKWILSLWRRVRFGARYRSRRFARLYDAGKRFEGSDGGLTRVLDRISNLDTAVVVDIGCGTGQMADRIANRVAAYHGFDTARAMIRFARWKYQKWSGGSSVEFATADARHIPLSDSTADVVIYPWSLNSIVLGGSIEGLYEAVEAVLAEGARVARSGGTLAVVETLNIANELPWGEVWHPGRRQFLACLERQHNMKRELFSNEWRFVLRRNVRRYAGIWFEPVSFRGADRRRATTLPECAGIWWKRVHKTSPGKNPSDGST